MYWRMNTEKERCVILSGKMFDSFAVAVLVTFLGTCGMYLKFQITNFRMGNARVKAGSRPPEDFYQNKHPTKDDVECADRAARIVQNDLENIPIGLIVAWFCVLGMQIIRVRSVFTFQVHTWCMIGFVVCRLIHSIAYSLQLFLPRAAAYGGSVVCVFGMLSNIGLYFL